MKVIAGWVAGLLLVIAAGAGMEAAVGTSAGAPPALYALVSNGPGSPARVVQLSLATGAVLRMVATLPLTPPPPVPDTCPVKRVYVDSLARADDGGLWVDESSHEPCQGNIALPSFPEDHCSGTVVRIDPAGGASRVVLRTSPTVALWGLSPTSDSSLVALVVGPCSVNAFHDWVVVVDLSTGRRWDVGTAAPPCTTLSDPVWLDDGAHLAVVVTTLHYYPGDAQLGFQCGGAETSQLAVLPAGQASTFHAAKLAQPVGAAGCEDDAVAPSGPQVLVAQSCGPDVGDDGYRGDGTVRSLAPDGSLDSTFKVPADLFAVDLCASPSATPVALELTRGVDAATVPPSPFTPPWTQLSMLQGGSLRILPSAPPWVAALAC